ncbi:hypothetical protein HanIR_Chr05g0208541 [Helianthus annuus]|nr:hypothetical protein HanIR_Chr05g0208541 [Helianthus annuus]
MLLLVNHQETHYTPLISWQSQITATQNGHWAKQEAPILSLPLSPSYMSLVV